MTPPLRKAIDRALARARDKRARGSTCPNCGKPYALLTLSLEGLKLGQLCRLCPWVSFTEGRKK